MSNLSQDEYESALANRLMLSSLNMQLAQQKADNPRVVTGAGEIRQNSTGQLSFTLFDRDTTSHITPAHEAGVRAGEIIPAEAYYVLRFVDVQGREWTTDRIFPDTTQNVSQTGIVWSGEFTAMSSTSKYIRPIRGRFLLNLHLSHVKSVPRYRYTLTTRKNPGGQLRSVNLDTWAFRKNKTGFRLIAERDRVSVSLEGPHDAFTNNYSRRVEEALQFVLCYPVRSVVVHSIDEDDERVEIASPRAIQGVVRQQPPLSFDFKYEKDMESVFSKYMKYVGSSAETIHPTSYEIGNMIRSSVHSLDIEALVITTAIESFVDREFAHIKVKVPKKKELALLQTLIAEAEIEEELRNRAIGCVSAITKPRAKDVLLELCRRRVLTDDHYETWNVLRNASVHSGIRKYTTRDLLRMCNIVRQLYYCLVFSKIGYKGHFKDYTVANFPIEVFPFRSGGES